MDTQRMVAHRRGALVWVNGDALMVTMNVHIAISVAPSPLFVGAAE